MKRENESVLNDEDVQVPEGVPEPLGWRLLVAPVRPRREWGDSKIVLPEEVMKAEETLTYLGKVVACGPLVGKKPEWPLGAFDIQVGDWVVFGRYAGQMFEFKGVKLRLVDDDQILAKAASPEGFRVYV